MVWSFVIFRYQADLKIDEWVPLGVVVERSFDNGAEIGVMCLREIDVEGAGELARAMLKDVPAILKSEVERSRAQMLTNQDFLEVLRAECPWNFHFTQIETVSLDTEDISHAAMTLFSLHVLPTKAKREWPLTIRSRRMEAFEVCV